ncbi:SDR family oxidoreductase [Streptomyces sp. NPDC102441]|uniref:SDR family oxidoreductase n=1 Tax=Streptomyces sp. NPDC102441 TaxID=3366176 RepID=UPI0038046176
MSPRRSSSSRAREIEQSVPNAQEPLALKCDVTDEAAATDTVGAIDRTRGRIDALVSKCGTDAPTEKLRLLDVDISDVRRVLDTNLVAGFIVTNALAPVMIHGGGGRVIHMSSMIDVQAGPGLAPYGASKAGLNLLANVAHRELADQEIRTVAPAPGLTDTGHARHGRRRLRRACRIGVPGRTSRPARRPRSLRPLPGCSDESIAPVRHPPAHPPGHRLRTP